MNEVAGIIRPRVSEPQAVSSTTPQQDVGEPTAPTATTVAEVTEPNTTHQECERSDNVPTDLSAPSAASRMTYDEFMQKHHRRAPRRGEVGITPEQVVQYEGAGIRDEWVPQHRHPEADRAVSAAASSPACSKAPPHNH